MSRECGVCHIGWLETLEEGKTSPAGQEWDIDQLRKKKEITVSEDVCYGCHDGFILDSRERVWMGKPHSVGRKPSAEVQVPNRFPLNEDGEVYCGTCHSPHRGSELSVAFSGRQFLRAENVDSHICKNCHLAKMGDPKHQNHPVDVLGEKPVPKDVYLLGGRLGSDPKKVICQSCHSPHGKSTLVADVERSALCVRCHGDKYYTGSLFQSGSSLHPVNVNMEPARWKSSRMPENAVVGRQGVLICSTCHSMHQGKAVSMLVLEQEKALCSGCHQEQAKAVSGSKHDLLKSAPQARNLRGETPGKSGTCRVCHLAHGWAQEMPPGSDPLSGRCLTCHQEEGGGASKKHVGTFSHPVNVAVESSPDAPSLPLWTDKGKQKVVCSSCHNAHRYEPAPASSTQPLDADGDPTNSFLRKTGVQLCTKCHPDKEHVQGTRHDLRLFEGPLKAEHRERITLGGPCLGCHRPHNAEGDKLWFKRLPRVTKEFDQDEATRRCLGCHTDESMKRIGEEMGHPVGRAIKPEYMPRPGDPLKLGIRSPETGEAKALVCTTCHLPHGRETRKGEFPLLFGSESSPQEFCVFCHRDKRKVIGSLHDFRTREKDEYAPDQGRSRKYGECSGCHVNHDARIEKKLLWFEIPEPIARGNPGDMPCLYCHGNPEVMKGRHAMFYVHPTGTEIEKILADKIEKGEITPLRELPKPEGQGASFLGYESIFRIRCMTCHDNHQGAVLWLAQEGALVPNPEVTSFLRGSSVPQLLCSKCHGEEALYRYRYFHQDRAFRRRVLDQ